MHRLARLAKAIDVDDRGQVVQTGERCMFEPLPHRTLGELPVAGQHPDPIGEPIQSFAGEGDADGDRQSLAERAGGDIDPRQDGCRVTLEAATALSVGRSASSSIAPAARYMAYSNGDA